MKLGFLGCGKIAYEHLRAARLLDVTELYACCLREDSPNRKRFRGRADVTFLDSIEDVHEASDKIICCLPWDYRGKLPDGKPMLIEKSAFRHRREGPTRIGYNRRSYTTVLKLKERIDQGGLKCATVTISEHVDEHIKRHGEEIVPFIIPFASCHMLDLVNFLFEPHSEAVMEGGNHNEFNGVIYSPEPIFLHLNMSDPSPAGISCKFNDGTRWALEPLERLRVYKGIAVSSSRVYTPDLVEQHIEPDSFKPGFLKQMNGFLEGDYSPGLEDEKRVFRLMEHIGVH